MERVSLTERPMYLPNTGTWGQGYGEKKMFGRPPQHEKENLESSGVLKLSKEAF